MCGVSRRLVFTCVLRVVSLRSAGTSSNSVVWFQNVTNVFTARNVSTVPALAVYDIVTVDLDGDGCVARQRWRACGLATTAEWHLHVVCGDPLTWPLSLPALLCRGRHCYVRSDLDVVSCSYGDDKVTWYANNGAKAPTFTVQTISSGAVVHGPKSVAVVDLDGDGDLDVVRSAARAAVSRTH